MKNHLSSPAGHQRLADHVRQSVGVVAPVNAVGRARRAGEIGRCGTGQEQHAIFVRRQPLDRERHRGVRDVDDGVDLAVVVPVLRDAQADIRLVLMIGADHLDRLAPHMSV